MKLIFASMENVNNFIELMNFQGTLSISAHNMGEMFSFLCHFYCYGFLFSSQFYGKFECDTKTK